MFNVPGGAGVHVLMEQIKGVLKKEAPQILRTVFRDAMKNDPRYRKEMVDIIKNEMNHMANKTAQGINAAQRLREDAQTPGNEVYGRTTLSGPPNLGNNSLYKQMKNKISYGVNTDKGSTLTNNGKRKIV